MVFRGRRLIIMYINFWCRVLVVINHLYQLMTSCWLYNTIRWYLTIIIQISSGTLFGRRAIHCVRHRWPHETTSGLVELSRLSCIEIPRCPSIDHGFHIFDPLLQKHLLSYHHLLLIIRQSSDWRVTIGILPWRRRIGILDDHRESPIHF